MIMKKQSLYILLATFFCVVMNSCKDDDYSETYDINFPVASLTSVSDAAPFVDDEITITGENLNTVTTVAIGAYRFPVVSVEETGVRMVVKVPRSVEPGILTLMNKYKREFKSEVNLAPQFYPVTVTDWPAAIEKGRTFTIKGENMDLIKEVKVNGTVVDPSGSPTPGQAAFTTTAAELSVGGTAIIEVTPKTGEVAVSPAINVIEASDFYMPKQTLMIADFEGKYVLENGSDAAKAEMTLVDGIFGKAFRVTSAAGNGWNGTYGKIYSDNGGNGFDLSTYNKPHITMLINTFGVSGYAQPILTDGENGEQDRHLTGAFGYGDDYKSTTDGWEWRSYDLEELGFPLVKGKLDRIGVQFRGGNIDGAPFDIAVDMVMITDGPLNPTIAWDAEKDVDSYDAGSFQIVPTGSNPAHIGYNQGGFYANYSGPSSTDWSKKVIAKTKCPALDPVVYQNGVWINFLVNSGNFGGYIQPCMGSGWMNLTKQQGYGDDYQLNPTNNEWQWRSIKVVPGEGDLSGWDATAEFDFIVQILGGNYSGDSMDFSCDYFVFTTVPLDPNLNTDELQ